MSEIAFRQAVWLVPVAVLLHVLEEWPRFPRWARRFASPDYTDREYVAIHAFGLATALAATWAVSRLPSPWLVFPFLALLVGPGLFWNAFFHVGGTLVSRAYCPGVLTGVVIYLPLASWLGALAVREGILGAGALAAAAAVAGAFHALEVARNVFKRRWGVLVPRRTA
jgi:hypothetical protein